MNMRKYLLILLLVLGLTLVACGGTETPAEPTQAPAATEAQVEPTAEPEPTEEPMAEPTEEPTAVPVMEASAEELDTAFQGFLASMEGYNTIGLEALNELLASDSPPFLLDVREVSELEEKGHIEGAINIPLREVADHIELLPSFDTTIVSYCGSGWRCTIAMTALEAMGWENVLSLKEGSFGGWLEAGYPVAEGAALEAEVLDVADPDPALVLSMQAMLQNVPEGFGGISIDDLNTELAENPDLILIDVRTPAEVEGKGYIDAPNVVFVPLEEFVAMRDMWPAQDAAIVTYCGSGHRSTIAMSILWSYGYTDVRSMKGGFAEWSAAGYPVIGAPEAAAPDLDTAFNTFLADMEAYNTIGLDDFNLMLAEDPPPLVLDVREVSEVEEKGHIESAVLIPLREVADNIELLPSFDTTIVSYCGSGWRCTIVMTALEALGWENVLALKENSFGGWVEAGYPVVEGLPPEALVLDVAEPDPALLAVMQEMLRNIPDGYGGISVDDLNTTLAENPDLIVIDVRTDEELADNGVIEAANFIHIPLQEFVNMKDMWPEDPDASIVVYCGSGHRSTIAMTILWTYGYSDVLSMKGGLAAWLEAGYPVIEYVAP
jgi:rhodanese-related sulfurtransferase